MENLKEQVKKALTDVKIKKLVNRGLPLIKKHIDDKKYPDLKNFIIFFSNEQGILNDQKLFGDFVQEILNKKLDTSEEFKKTIKELKEEYNLIGLVF